MIDTERRQRAATADLSKVMEARGWEELEARALRALGAIGISDFMLKMDILAQTGARASHLFGSLPAALHEPYRASVDAESDPVRPHIEKSGLPFAWSTAQLCRPGTGPLYTALLDAAVCDGLSVKVRGEHATSRIDLYRKGFDSSPFPSSMHADALLASVHLHEAVESLWLRTTKNQKPLLSAREIECLGWSARGKTCAEVGLILGISERTVHFHLKNAAAKFDVHSTRHAISRAYMLGIFKPGK